MNRTASIKALRTAFGQQRLTLFLGAGVSVANGLPTWEKLVLSLYFSTISEQQMNGWRPYANYLYAISEWYLKRSIEPLEITARKTKSFYENSDVGEKAFLDAIRDAPPRNPWDILWDAWATAGPGAFAGVTRNPFGKRGSPTTQEDLEAILKEIRPLNRKDKEHVAGGRNYKGELIPEERIPGPGGGQEGSISPDATIVTKGGHVIRIEQQDMDMKTGKASKREIGKQQTEFNRTQSQGYNVPWSYVLGILKGDHMRKYQEKLDRQKRPKRRPQRDEDDDNQR